MCTFQCLGILLLTLCRQIYHNMFSRQNHLAALASSKSVPNSNIFIPSCIHASTGSVSCARMPLLSPLLPSLSGLFVDPVAYVSISSKCIHIAEPFINNPNPYFLATATAATGLGGTSDFSRGAVAMAWPRIGDLFSNRDDVCRFYPTSPSNWSIRLMSC